jgi:hypothetical protein
VLVADDDGVPFGQRRRDHGMPCEQPGDPDGQLGVAMFAALADPRGGVGGQAEAGMVGRCDMRDDAVDGPDLDTGTDTPFPPSRIV